MPDVLDPKQPVQARAAMRQVLGREPFHGCSTAYSRQRDQIVARPAPWLAVAQLHQHAARQAKNLRIGVQLGRVDPSLAHDGVQRTAQCSPCRPWSGRYRFAACDPL